MNRGSSSRVAAAAINYHHQANPFRLFHSTPILERRRRNHWDSASAFRSTPKVKFNQYSKRLRKQSMLRNVSEFAEHLFQSWESGRDEFDQPPSQGSSWYRPNFREDGFSRGKSRNKRSHSRRRDFEFCDADDDVVFETIFRAGFRGSGQQFCWFTNDDEPRYGNPFRDFNGWKYQFHEEYDSSSESEKPVKDVTSDRLALGLKPSGPLNLEDVKTAYRACALKWHPDRHQGSSKVVAEEKFKLCSAAYQSLCDKLALH